MAQRRVGGEDEGDAAAGAAVAERGAAASGPAVRLRMIVRGAVQGVGFRPFVYRRARALRLGGWVENSTDGVVLEVEGARGVVETFRDTLRAQAPPRADIDGIETTLLAPTGDAAFTIRASSTEGRRRAAVLPDLATCPECLDEILDPGNRRYRYPFTNCTSCGPRYSIIRALPYDRAHTTMRDFVMCPACRAEYVNPADRRFHAQPNACPDCGPQLALWDRRGRVIDGRDAALAGAVDAIRAGAIVALKGLGGFHLMADAANAGAVRRLRECKRRPDKPFAVMFADIAGVAAYCEVSALERRLLQGPEAPIVLLRRHESPCAPAPRIADEVAPGNPNLGVMLAYTPLHHLLVRGLSAPVVATSGNRADEPLAFDELEALARLAHIAELFLVHDRPIRHAVDDSVVRVMAGRELVLRRARGYAPSAVRLPVHAHRPVLALGGHLKNTVCMAFGNEAVLGPHVGDLGSAEAAQALDRSISGLTRLYRRRPAVIACDLHPDYASTRRAPDFHVPVVRVQHHLAHVLACLAEHARQGPALGVAWDGAGYGVDATVWGGEFILVSAAGFRRIAHWRPFRLPGGEAAVREPRRAALGLLYEIFGPAVLDLDYLAPVRAFAPNERRVLGRMLARGVNAPWTSSAGRLFDAVAAVLGIRQRASYEGQAAAELEWCLPARAADARCALAVDIREGEGGTGGWVLDWEPMLRSLLGGMERPEAAALFHDTLVGSIVEVARRAGESTVVLSGGCFQNRYLTERAVARLRAEGFEPCWHRRVPPNDGGLSLGQVLWAAQAVATGEVSCA